MKERLAVWGFVAVLAWAGAGEAHGHSITVDGDASDWIGTPPSSIHDVTTSAQEWIYKGDTGDMRTDPPTSSTRPNYDITEVRLTCDETNLYLLVRFADVTATNEVSVCFGVDLDMSAGDGSLNFNGDESGLTYGGVGAKMPEYIVQIHNPVNGVTDTEIYDDNDGNGTNWYAPPVHDEFISVTNNLLEASIPLASLGLTTATTFGFSLASFDNGTTGDPSGTAYNNAEDTTVDYPVCDALDCIGGTVGVSQSAFARDLSDGDLDYQFVVTLPQLVPVGISGWMLE